MKKILYLFLIIFLSAGYTACSEDALEVAPTDRVAGPTIFKDINSATVAMDGVYRALFISGWTDGNTHQNFGILSTKMYTSLMGEDFLQDQWVTDGFISITDTMFVVVILQLTGAPMHPGTSTIL